MIKEKKVDFGKQSSDYAEHRPGFPPKFFNKLTHLLANRDSLYEEKEKKSSEWDWSKKRCLDLGTGPGIVALELAARGATVVGVDVAANQISAAQGLAKKRGLDALATFMVAGAEDTKQDEKSFDLVVAAQAWPWFQQEKAMKEIQRILKKDGVFVICHFCYLPKSSPVAKDTEDLILKYNPKYLMYGFDGLYPKQVDKLVVEGGFDLIEQFCFDHQQPFTHVGWRGRMRTCNGVGSGVLTDDQVKAWDNELAELLKKKYPEEPMMVLHRIWSVVVRLRPESNEEVVNEKAEKKQKK